MTTMQEEFENLLDLTKEDGYIDVDTWSDFITHCIRERSGDAKWEPTKGKHSPYTLYYFKFPKNEKK